MFRKYGVIGLLLVLFAQLNFFFKVEPFASRYFIIIWLGYILVLDALVYRVKRHSYLMNRPGTLLGLFLLSAVFWWTLSLVNLRVGDWGDDSIWGWEALKGIAWKTLYFSTVLPAMFETFDLLRSYHLFDRVKLQKAHRLTPRFLHVMTGLGFVTLLLPLAFPTYFYPLIWLTFFFLLDPINYLHHQPSIIGHLKDRKLAIPLSLFAAGIIMGFFWEFWNYWAVTKWYYNVPFMGFVKIFEMPLLGYLGYFPFAWELYAMYSFVGTPHKEEVKLEGLLLARYLKRFRQ